MTETHAWGQQTVLSLEGRVAYLLSHTEEVDDSVRIKSDPMFGVGLTYGYPDRGVGFSIEQVVQDLDDGITDGRLVMVPILMTGYWRFVGGNRPWTPFMGIGVGVFSIQFKTSGEGRSEAENAGLQNFDQDIDDTIGFQAQAGIEYSVWKKLSMVLDVRYFYVKADVRTTSTQGPSQDKIDLSTVVAGIGIKQSF
jgi:outer membrane protein W